MDSTEESSITPPKLLVYNPSDGWEAYQEILYKHFQDALVNGNLTFQGLRVSVKRVPPYKGKHFAFWHLTSEGEKEDERTPDFRRCERILWVAWIINNAGKNKDITFWENKRGSNRHTVIWHEKENYAVVLARRNNYFLLKTAYIHTERRAQMFRREREEYNRQSNKS